MKTRAYPSEILLSAVNRQFAASVAPNARVLDAGAGQAPYRELFAHANYETADFKQVDKPYAEQTYTCDLAHIPVEDGYFDHVVFNQVLEHIPDPLAVLKELNRVLKDGGTILCSCPFFFEEHEQPFDFYRYTQFAHKYLFPKAGFRLDRVDWLEGYFGTVGHQLRRIGKNLPIFDRRILLTVRGLLALPVLILIKAVCMVSAQMISALDLHIRILDRGYPKNYVVLATKNATSAVDRLQETHLA